MPIAPRRGPIALAYRALVLPGVIAYLFSVSIVVLAADRFWLVDLLTFAWPYVIAAGSLLVVAALVTRRLKAIVIAGVGLAIALIPAADVPTARGRSTVRACSRWWWTSQRGASMSRTRRSI